MSLRPARLVVALAALLVAIVSAPPSAPAQAAEPRRAARSGADAGRVLILSLPYVAWTDLNDARLPNLDRLLDGAAIANLSTRAPTLSVGLAGGYVTLGSGDKAVGSKKPTDGVALGVDETFGRDSAAEVFEQRTGRKVTRGIVHLGIAGIETANADSIFDADIGVLGDALADAGFSRAVIANGDGSQPPDPPESYRREAVAALMSSRGTLPEGDVGPGLLEEAPRSPFGLRTDLDAYADAFERVWKPRSVVLVEASDLVRADAYLEFADDHARDLLRRRALERTDALVGRLLERVDPRRDGVVVVGPAPSAREPMLTVAAVRAPGFEPGLLRSGTTQRSGFVQLIDLAPTVLELVGVARPDSMRGRVLRTGDGGGSAADRRSFLADADAAARFRSRIQAPAAAIFIALQGLLAFATVLALAGWARLRRSAVLPTAAVMLLAYFPAVYLARALPLHDAGPGAYYAFVLTVSAALGFAARILGRRHALDPILIALGMIVFVLVVDVTVLGSTLQFNSALGFSPEVAGRFIGFGNAGYAALAAASILLAGLVAHRFAGGRGVKFALALLAVVILADAAPFWGADVGGVLSMVPAFGITALLLLGKQIKARSVLAFGVATLVALAAATGLDLARSPGNRTHLGRLAEQTRDEGSSAFTSVISRKIQLNLSALNSNWRFLVPIVLALVAYLAFWPPRHLILLLRRIPELAIALIGFTILMVLGFALNDSGVVVPGVMLGVLSPVLVALVIPTAASSTPDPRIPRDGDSTALDRPAASV